MSAGLSNILSVNTDFVSQKSKTIEELYKAGETLGDRIRNIRDYYKDQKFEIDNVNDASVSDRQTFITELVDIQLLDLIQWSKVSSYKAGDYVLRDNRLYKAKVLIPANTTWAAANWDENPGPNPNLASLVTPHLSFEASGIRNDILAWILERMAGDIEIEIDAIDHKLDIVTKWSDGVAKSISAVEHVVSEFPRTNSFLDGEYVEHQGATYVHMTHVIEALSSVDEKLNNPLSSIKIDNEITGDNRLNKMKEFLVKEIRSSLEIIKKAYKSPDRYQTVDSYSPTIHLYHSPDITDDEKNELQKISIVFSFSPNSKKIFIAVELEKAFIAKDENNTILYQAEVYRKILSAIITEISPILKVYRTRSLGDWARYAIINVIPALSGEIFKPGLEICHAHKFYDYAKLKAGFDRAADCTSNFDAVLEHNMSYLRAGYAFQTANQIKSFAAIQFTLSYSKSIESVKLEWTAVPDNTTLHVIKNGNYHSAATGTTTTIDNLTLGTHDFYMIALNDAGTVVAQSNTVTFQTGIHLGYGNLTNSLLQLNWSSHPDLKSIASYKVHEKDKSDDTTKDYTPTETSIDITGLTANTVYEFYVEALDSNGSSLGKSNTVTVTTPAL